MAIKLPESARKVLQDKAYGHVVTFGADGRPQVTMVWVDADGDDVLFNTAEGRKKPQNLRRDRRIVISVQDRNDPQAYMLIHLSATLRKPAPTRTSTSLPSASSAWTSIRTVSPAKSGCWCASRRTGSAASVPRCNPGPDRDRHRQGRR